MKCTSGGCYPTTDPMSVEEEGERGRGRWKRKVEEEGKEEGKEEEEEEEITLSDICRIKKNCARSVDERVVWTVKEVRQTNCKQLIV